jgi:hypothetical protein
MKGICPVNLHISWEKPRFLSYLLGDVKWMLVDMNGCQWETLRCVEIHPIDRLSGFEIVYLLTS